MRHGEHILHNANPCDPSCILKAWAYMKRQIFVRGIERHVRKMTLATFVPNGKHASFMCRHHAHRPIPIPFPKRTVCGHRPEAEESKHGPFDAAHASRAKQNHVGVFLPRILYNVTSGVGRPAHTANQRCQMDVLNLLAGSIQHDHERHPSSSTGKTELPLFTHFLPLVLEQPCCTAAKSFESFPTPKDWACTV